MLRLAVGTGIFLAAGSSWALPTSAIALNSGCSAETFPLTDEPNRSTGPEPVRVVADVFPWSDQAWHSLSNSQKTAIHSAKAACFLESSAIEQAEPERDQPELPDTDGLPTAIAENVLEISVESSSAHFEISSQLADPEPLEPPLPGLTSEQFSKPETEDPPIGDEELGILRLREDPVPTPPATPSAPILYLFGRVDYLSSDNIFLNEVDPVGDAFIRPGLTLLAVPPIGPRTNFVASADVKLLRYRQVEPASYDELQLQAGFRHAFSPRAYGQINWTNQQLYRAGFADQFFNSHSLDLALWRSDQLSSKLSLNSYYQARFSFSDPDEFSRITQFVGAALFYQINPQLQAGLNYQLTLSDFIQRVRFDTYHQLTAQAVYSLSPSTRLRLFGGFSFGESSDSAVNFNDTLFGVTFDFDLPLF
ncbi:hypothetical protein [Sphaerothrix gracilis]|uniref:hypothetical protein n=1 Tax=Sphaerothrix gracilis TaxID=3151835 RepID=UPI0031FCC9B7